MAPTGLYECLTMSGNAPYETTNDVLGNSSQILTRAALSSESEVQPGGVEWTET